MSDDLDDDDDVATRLGHWYRSNYGDLHAATEAFHDAPDAPPSDGEGGDDEPDEVADAVDAVREGLLRHLAGELLGGGG